MVISVQRDSGGGHDSQIQIVQQQFGRDHAISGVHPHKSSFEGAGEVRYRNRVHSAGVGWNGSLNNIQAKRSLNIGEWKNILEGDASKSLYINTDEKRECIRE